MSETTEEAANEGDVPWVIADESRAAWAVDKVLTARERLARIKATCAAMIAEAQRDVESAESFFLPHLEAWARANPPRKGKTLKLTTGALSFRTVPGGPRVVDAAVCLEWARDHAATAIVVKETLSAASIKDYVEATGEIPPGVEVAEARESFDVRGV